LPSRFIAEVWRRGARVLSDPVALDRFQKPGDLRYRTSRGAGGFLSARSARFEYFNESADRLIWRARPQPDGQVHPYSRPTKS